MVDEQIIDPNTAAPQDNTTLMVPQGYSVIQSSGKSAVDAFNPYNVISIYDKSFWDLWVQKIFRNLSSMKCQFLWAFFWTIIYGMFIGVDKTGNYFINPTLGLGFLSGGFITLVTARLAVRTSLFESPNDPLDSDN